jgi:uncharacterized glyoxalase superfamily protein PhnB
MGLGKTAQERRTAGAWDVSSFGGERRRRNREKARQAGYQIVQEPKKYDFGTEAFIADPDGCTWAFVSPPKIASDR